jgi:cholesterol 7alpha-monooxygenase
VARVFTVDPNARYNEKLSKPLHPTDAMLEFYHHHIAPGNMFDAFLKETANPGILREMDLDAVSPPNPAVLSRSAESITISLKTLCENTFIRGTARSYYGPKLLEILPDFTSWYLKWEHVNWKYLFNLPRFMSRDMTKVKNAMIDTLTRYFKIPQEERQCDNYFINSTEDSLREAGVTDEEIARLIFMQTWAYVFLAPQKMLLVPRKLTQRTVFWEMSISWRSGLFRTLCTILR